jgi:hypothetical protein
MVRLLVQMPGEARVCLADFPKAFRAAPAVWMSLEGTAAEGGFQFARRGNADGRQAQHFPRSGCGAQAATPDPQHASERPLRLCSMACQAIGGAPTQQATAAWRRQSAPAVLHMNDLKTARRRRRAADVGRPDAGVA